MWYLVMLLTGTIQIVKSVTTRFSFVRLMISRCATINIEISRISNVPFHYKIILPQYFCKFVLLIIKSIISWFFYVAIVSFPILNAKFEASTRRISIDLNTDCEYCWTLSLQLHRRMKLLRRWLLQLVVLMTSWSYSFPLYFFYCYFKYK